MVPNSVVFAGPFGVNSKRSAFIAPTSGIATLYRSGLSVIALPINIPPALAPSHPILLAEVYLLSIKYSAHALKSFHVLGLLAFFPARYQFNPFSLPPRT